MPATQMLSSYLRGGWQVVCKGDLGGNLDFLLPDGSDGDQIHIGECILLARPAGIDAKARLAHERAALEPVEGSRQMVISGLDMPGGNHPSALRSNKINVTRESIEVPRDRDY